MLIKIGFGTNNLFNMFSILFAFLYTSKKCMCVATVEKKLSKVDIK